MRPVTISPKTQRRSVASPQASESPGYSASPAIKEIQPKDQGTEESVKVVCRVRPFNQREIELHRKAVEGKAEWEMHPIRSIVEFSGNNCFFLDHEHDYVEKERFTYDCCLWSIPDDMQSSENPFASQIKMFQEYGEVLLTQAWKGYNTCFLAYGQTGSGKTHSMMGKLDDSNGTPADPGMIPRLGEALFDQVESARIKAQDDKDKYIRTFKITIQYLEIYNEMVKDLLWQLNDLPPDVKAKMNPDNLKIRYNPVTGVFVEHLTTVQANSWKDLVELIDLGNSSRTTAATKMNDRSSRSHAVFKVMLTQMTTTVPKKQFEKPTEHLRESTINLVDLAGSERNKKTGATGDRLKEAALINKSLSTLKSVIDALVDNCTTKGPKKRVPYRDSHLTSILMDSLGGNSKTFMLVTISPHQDNADETLQSLRYGAKARLIVVVVHVNENAAGRMMMDLEEELKRMKLEMEKTDDKDDDVVEDLRAQIAQHELQMKQMEDEMKQQQAKLTDLEVEKAKHAKQRQMMALSKMETLIGAASKKREVATEEAKLREKLSTLTMGKMECNKRKAEILEEMQASGKRIEELEVQKKAMETETDNFQNKMSKAETSRWECQRKIEETTLAVKNTGRDRIADIMRHWYEIVRKKIAHRKRMQNRIIEHAEQMELQKQKMKKMNEDLMNENNQSLSVLEQQRDSMRADLNALKAELVRVEAERAKQIEAMEEKVQNLQLENKKRKEAMTQRLATMVSSYEKRYNNMVATMEKQYRELIDECNKRHQTEEERQDQQLGAIRQKHTQEIRELEKEWRGKIDNAIIKGKKEFQETKQRWERQLQERRHWMEDLRAKLREVEAKEQEFAALSRRVAATLERTQKPRGTVAKKFYDLLELYHGQYDECHPSYTLLQQLLTKDVNKRRCPDPPTIGLSIPDDSKEPTPAPLRRRSSIARKTSIANIILSLPPPDASLLHKPTTPRSATPPPKSTLFFSARIRSRSPAYLRS